MDPANIYLDARPLAIDGESYSSALGELHELSEAAAAGAFGDVGGDIRQLWYHPRSRAALMWDDDDDDEERAAARSTSVADAVATAGVYGCDGFTMSKHSGGGIGIDAFRPTSTPRQEDREEAGFTFAELGVKYEFVPPRRFGDPSLFLDFRPTRRWVRSRVAEMVAARGGIGNADDDAVVVKVLNAFSYTCGVGLAAADGGAGRVLNTDHSATYLGFGSDNAALNGFEPVTSQLCEDFYPAVRQLAGLSMPGRVTKGGGRGGGGGRRGGRGGRRHGGGGRGSRGAGGKLKKAKKIKPESFDIVVLDPPTMTKTAGNFSGKHDLSLSLYLSPFSPIPSLGK